MPNEGSRSNGGSPRPRNWLPARPYAYSSVWLYTLHKTTRPRGPPRVRYTPSGTIKKVSTTIPKTRTKERQGSPTRARTQCHRMQPCLHSSPFDTSSINVRHLPLHHHQHRQRCPSACRFRHQHQHQGRRRHQHPRRHPGRPERQHAQPPSARRAYRGPRAAHARDQTNS